MSVATLSATKIKKIVYSDRDGKRMSDNTLQFEWIVTLKENLEILFHDNPNIFVAGDLLWYPVEGDNKIRIAPDAMVALGRPKGYRGSYRQWEEGGIAPQVVFEVLSQGNRRAEMDAKFNFYEAFGVEEYYVLDPYPKRKRSFGFKGWRRDAFNLLQPIAELHNYVSLRLKIRFDTSSPTELAVYRPEGRRFLTMMELGALQERTERERDTERAARERMAARLRELGVDPDTV